MAKKVKLQLYQMKSIKEVILDSVVAETFDDFIIAKVTSPNLGDELMAQVQLAFAETGKKVIVVPLEMEIEFYGFELDEDNNSATELPSN